MDTLLKKLLFSFDRVNIMQKAHIKIIKECGKHHPDLSRQNFERAQAFEDLKNHLIPVLKNIKGDSNSLTVIRECQDRFEAIKKLDDALFGLFVQYRNRLNQQKQEINHGKKALRGYGGHYATRSPRFFNMPV